MTRASQRTDRDVYLLCARAYLAESARRGRTDMEYWQVTGGSAVCTDRRVLLGYVDTLTTLVRAQAEDEGLWFLAATAPEAYLQDALRRLHHAIEGTTP